jgi:hypothetical protein
MVISIDTKVAKQRVDDAERVPIFSIDGAEYSIPKVQRSEIQLRYLDIANARGDEAANYYLLTTMLGQDGYDALAAVDGLSDEDFQGVIDAVSKVVFPAQSPKGRGKD